jgi:GT2 family glycosyltransferase
MVPMDLSVIILSYNTAKLTKQCLDDLLKSLESSHLKSEVIVVDNNSKDDSVKMLENYKNSFKSTKTTIVLIKNAENAGYPKGNNQGLHIAKGQYILLLNSDAMIQNVEFDSLIEYMDKNEKVGVLTVKLNLSSGEIDPASHRGFPTIWNSFCYFTKLEKLFGRIPVLGPIFGGYHLYFKELNSIHEIDAPAGAFFLTRNTIMQKVHGFDETFFMYGEDLDLAYRIKELGYKVLYYPKYTALHMKHHSGIKHVDEEVRKRTRKHFYEAMKIFFNKHYKQKYPAFVTNIVFFFIDLKSKL